MYVRVCVCVRVAAFVDKNKRRNNNNTCMRTRDDRIRGTHEERCKHKYAKLMQDSGDAPVTKDRAKNVYLNAISKEE